ncbi:MAG: hypothetical protein HYZ49_11190 [Chloroflexi bacterium]|nr:hypothetical protein [Chloroflexota bacterium]
MIVLDLKLVLLLSLLVLAGLMLLAIAADRRHFRETLLIRKGADASEIRQALEAAPFGLAFLNLEFECIYANAYARRFLGLALASGQLPETIWRAELYKDLATARQSDTSQTHYRILTLPSDQTLSWWICSLPDLSLVFLLDLSDQRRTEKTARLFLANLSHELRTPLTSILAHLEVVRLPDISEAIRQNSLNLIHQETNRIAKMVRDLLRVSRMELVSDLELKPTDLFVVAERAIAEIILIAEERQILISLEVDAPIPFVLGDPDLLYDVFLNILDNAVKYCRPGDRVDVSLNKHHKGVYATIGDSGPGIPPEHLPHVAERLYRARTDVPGSGLGLALVEEILRHHHTRLEIESRCADGSTGTTVSFLLPIAAASQGSYVISTVTK